MGTILKVVLALGLVTVIVFVVSYFYGKKVEDERKTNLTGMENLNA